MCEDFQPLNKKQATAFKIVVVKSNGEEGYYSVLTGNQYPTNKDMPVWTSQRNNIGFFVPLLPGNAEKHKLRMTDDWKPDVDEYNTKFWSKEMVGRTAAFKIKTVAHKVRNSWLYSSSHFSLYSPSYNIKTKGFRLVVVKVRLTKDLMTAKYMKYKCVLGRHMEILEEVA